VLDTIRATLRHTYQVLTKRLGRMAAVMRQLQPAPLLNLWLGTSIEDDRYVWRADRLRDTPTAVRFLSLEPLLGPVPSLDLVGIDWVIVGGESGSRYGPMDPAWVRECVTAASMRGWRSSSSSGVGAPQRLVVVRLMAVRGMSIHLELVEGEQRWFMPGWLGSHSLFVSPSHELGRFGVVRGVHHVIHHLGTVAAFNDGP
jgi:hypothetical protein